jgi:hypothetical protein
LIKVDLPERVEPSRRKEQPNFGSGNMSVSIFCRGIGLASATDEGAGALIDDSEESEDDTDSALFLGGISNCQLFFL